MILHELLSNNVSVSVNANQLIEFFDYYTDKKCKELEKEIKEKNEERYLTPNEVCERLSVTRSTLWRYAKENYLSPIRVGGKVRYASADIRKILNR